MIIGPVPPGILGVALSLAALCLIVALLASAWRLVRGPTLADRIIALDLVSVLLVAFLLVFGLVSGTGAYLYAAIGLALVAFLATIAFARYLERRDPE